MYRLFSEDYPCLCLLRTHCECEWEHDAVWEREKVFSKGEYLCGGRVGQREIRMTKKKEKK